MTSRNEVHMHVKPTFRRVCKHLGQNTIIIVQFLKHFIEENIEGTGKEEDKEEDVSS